MAIRLLGYQHPPPHRAGERSLLPEMQQPDAGIVRWVCGRPATLLVILAFSHAPVLTNPWPYDGMDL
jgi:hypothetical protein